MYMKLNKKLFLAFFHTNTNHRVNHASKFVKTHNGIRTNVAKCSKIISI